MEIEAPSNEPGWDEKWCAQEKMEKKRKKRTRPISSHLDRTSLVNKRFIIWHIEHWKKCASYLFIFEHWKGNQLDAKVMAHAWLDKCWKYNQWLVTFQIQISNSNFQIFKFKTNFCVCRFLLQKVFLKLIKIFVFTVFILVNAFSSSTRTEKSQKISENNFGERNFLSD